MRGELKPLAYLSWPVPELPLRFVRGIEALQAWQAGRCAACGCFRSDALVVDHDHVTGLIRGLLCMSCNGCEGRGNPGFEPYRLRPPAEILGIVELYEGLTYGPWLPPATSLLERRNDLGVCWICTHRFRRRKRRVFEKAAGQLVHVHESCAVQVGLRGLLREEVVCELSKPTA